LNILLLDQFSDPGGAQLCLRDLLPGMLERGWRPRLMIPGQGSLFEAAEALGVPTFELPLSSYSCGRKTAADLLRFALDLPRAIMAVRRVVNRCSIDLVYVNGPRVLPVALGCSRPTVFHSHSLLGKKYARGLASIAVRQTGANVIAACRFLADPWTRVIPRERVRIVYSGVPDQRGQLHRKFNGPPFRVGLIGRIAPEKGHLDFIEAARRVGESRTDVRFHVYGSALFSDSEYEARVRRIAEGLPLEFHGWVANVPEALRELDILVVPSKAHDAAPRIVMEALSAGTPVVAYPSGGIPELFEDGRSGVLCPSPTPAMLARAIQDLLEHADRMTRQASAGRAEWEKRFTLERYRREICDLLQRVACAPATI
jgi:hypothetical protein